MPEPLLRGLRVLAVDADPGTASLYEALLQVEGADGRVATDGITALAHVEPAWWVPDAVLTDMHLPDMESHELARAVLARSASPVALIATTVDERPPVAVVARAAGFSACLLKPVNLQRLCWEIVTAVRGVRDRSRGLVGRR